MKLEGTQQRLSVYIGQSDQHDRTLLAIEITAGLVVLEDVEVVTYVRRKPVGR